MVYYFHMDLSKSDLKAAKKFFQVHHPVWGFVLLLAIIVGLGFGWQQLFADRLLPHLYVGGVGVGRLTREEALNRLTERAKQLEDRGLRYNFKDHQVALGATEGASSNLESAVTLYTFDPDGSLDAAWKIGHQEQWIMRWFDQLRSLFLPREVPFLVDLNIDILTAQLQKEFTSFTVSPKSARFVWRQGKLEVAPSEPGTGFMLEQLIAETEAKLKAGQPVEMPLVLTSLEPLVKEQTLTPLKSLVSPLVASGPVYAELSQPATTGGPQHWYIGNSTLAGFFTAGDNGQVVLDNTAMAEYLARLNKVVEVPVREARFNIENGRVTEFAPSEVGRGIDVAATEQVWQKSLFKSGPRTLLITLRDVAPEVTTANANEFGIRELIGVGKSQFAGSPKNRRHNIALGAERLNGLLLKPGEEFSLLNALGPVDGEHGFLQELVIKEGRTIPEFGGGLCQIGTTTFRMALASGMPILERQNHSYRVVYYEPAGTDATIYFPKPDFRFKNDTGHYVLIQTKIQGDEAIFELWGTKDGRKVEQTKPIVSHIVKPPPGRLIETTDLPVGKKKCTERAHDGATAKFTYNVTYPNGELKTQEFRSYYKPWQEVCLIGVGALSTPAPAAAN